MSKSNYLENKILDHALGTTAFTQPTNQYLALHTADPTDAASGQNFLTHQPQTRQVMLEPLLILTPLLVGLQQDQMAVTQ